MLQMLIGTNIPFMQNRRYAYILSTVMVVSTIVWLLVHGGPALSVDFTGGSVLQIRTSQVLAADEVRRAIDAAGFRGVELQQMTGQNRDEFLVRFRSEGRDPFPIIQQALASRFPGVTAELRRQETVGPKVGNELSHKAIWAVLWSMGGILLYVGIRYEFKFAFGAIVALFHDVFVVL